MTKVVEAIRKGDNAMLESPTGTGKTISLLSAAIATIKAERDRNARRLAKGIEVP